MIGDFAALHAPEKTSLKLFMFPIAPNPTKVRLYLAEKRAMGASIDLEEELVNLGEGEQNGPEFLAKNPFGALPVLELDDGRHLHESLTIIDYLEEKFPEPSLWGTDAEQRAMARQIERIADLGTLLTIGSIVHATNSPLGRAPNPVIADHDREKLMPRLAYFDRLLGDGRSFLAGEKPTVGDCTFAAALQFGRFREMDFTEGHPGIQRWHAHYRDREPTAGILVV